jgi:hypothetical protein
MPVTSPARRSSETARKPTSCGSPSSSTSRSESTTGPPFEALGSRRSAPATSPPETSTADSTSGVSSPNIMRTISPRSSSSLRSRISPGPIEPTLAPLRRIDTRSPISIASWSLCVMSTMARPSAFSRSR